MDPQQAQQNTVPQETTIYLVRHGVPYNPAGIMYGRAIEPPLAEEGYEQGRDIAEYFVKNNIPIDAIVSSPLTRTVQTAGSIAAWQALHLNQEPVEIQRDERLLESLYAPGIEGSLPQNLHGDYYNRPPKLREPNYPPELQTMDDIVSEVKSFGLINRKRASRILRETATYMKQLNSEDPKEIGYKKKSLHELRNYVRGRELSKEATLETVDDLLGLVGNLDIQDPKDRTRSIKIPGEVIERMRVVASRTPEENRQIEEARREVRNMNTPENKPRGETPEMIAIRMKEGIQNIIENNAGKNVVVVSHGDPIGFLLWDLMHKPEHRVPSIAILEEKPKYYMQKGDMRKLTFDREGNFTKQEILIDGRTKEGKETRKGIREWRQQREVEMRDRVHRGGKEG